MSGHEGIQCKENQFHTLLLHNARQVFNTNALTDAAVKLENIQLQSKGQRDGERKHPLMGLIIKLP